ncbi:histidine kinase [Massilia sp. CFBP9012]|uniref:sensor histidine kinase n=1 Tax=Massilia sp. CFBP9012 TaxID=3096531 RepID=UPI002A6A5870|nr:histidine kinase [Massilia sp. CFBP9012]MDY0975245.1 histidine kinase [Massilia sp. CFBP9012]
MWKRIEQWNREVEAEQLAVLRDPTLVAQVPAGCRRFFARKLAQMSPAERESLYQFSSTVSTSAALLALLKLFVVLSVVGFLINLAFLPARPWWHTVLAANAIGLAMAMSLMGVWFNYGKIVRAKGKALVTIVGLGLVGGLFGGLTAMFETGGNWSVLLDRLPRIVVTVTIVVTALVAIPTIVIAVLRNRHYQILAEQLKRDAEQERLARELSETQLRLLRAQIEPHFLFNTLGAVQQLAEQGAPRAAELTSHLIDFLRASMSDMRCEQVALATEFGLVESYLRVMQIRMGERLRYTVDVPAALASTQVPSMLVLTLAENAIKHGIEPSLAGGEIVVTAHDDEGTIRIRVRDSGVGMSDTPGAGTGLENVRHRLRLAYGEGACLLLSEAEPGLLAEIAIPCKEPK